MSKWKPQYGELVIVTRPFGKNGKAYAHNPRLTSVKTAIRRPVHEAYDPEKHTICVGCADTRQATDLGE